MTDKELLSKWKEEWIGDIVSDECNPLPKLTDFNVSKAFLSSDAFARWGVCYQDVSALDFSNMSLTGMKAITFNHSTKWPKMLPKGFNPCKIIKNSVSKSKSLKQIHQMNITGKGTKCVVIDQPLAFPLRHKEIAEINIKQKTQGSIIDYGYNFHGEAVLSYLCGKNLGVAPECEIEYYFSTPIYYEGATRQQYNIDTFWHQVDILKKILQRVKNGEKIDAINLSSRPLMYVDEYFTSGKENAYKLYNKLCRNLEKFGCVIIEGTERHAKNFFSCEIDFTDDINDYDSYRYPKPCSFYNYKPQGNKIGLLCGGRAVPEFFSENNYKYEPFSCDSWVTPQVTGYFLLSRQLIPNISFDEFLKLCKQSSFRNNNGILILDALTLVNNLKNNFITENL